MNNLEDSEKKLKMRWTVTLRAPCTSPGVTPSGHEQPGPPPRKDTFITYYRKNTFHFKHTWLSSSYVAITSIRLCEVREQMGVSRDILLASGDPLKNIQGPRAWRGERDNQSATPAFIWVHEWVIPLMRVDYTQDFGTSSLQLVPPEPTSFHLTMGITLYCEDLWSYLNHSPNLYP